MNFTDIKYFFRSSNGGASVAQPAFTHWSGKLSPVQSLSVQVLLWVPFGRTWDGLAATCGCRGIPSGIAWFPATLRRKENKSNQISYTGKQISCRLRFFCCNPLWDFTGADVMTPVIPHLDKMEIYKRHKHFWSLCINAWSYYGEFQNTSLLSHWLA